jgi:uncharacterized protein (TIGR02145 family)
MKNILRILSPALIIIFTSCNPDEEATNSSNSGNGGGSLSNPGAGVTFGGYTYSTIVFGNGQEWMAENLRTTSYANGDPIPNVPEETQWSNLSTGAWVHYNNDSQYENPYGKLYNWYAVNDSRNVCPNGWHVPTVTEWDALVANLGGVEVAGGKMKSTQYWQSPNTDATNESGFSGLPGGSRYLGEFIDIGYYGDWWSSTELNNNDVVWYRNLLYLHGASFNYTSVKRNGLCVRCLRD